MANNKIQVKRTTVSGRTPNTTGSYSTNSQYISAGEFALNMADGILYSSNGSAPIAIGANNVNVNITGNATVKAIIANGSIGSSGEILASNGSGLYWTSVGGTGTVTQIDTGNGLSGGPITGTGTISVVANDGIIANSSGLFVKAGTGIVVNASGVHVTAGVNTDAQYIWTNTHTFNQTINGTANNANYLGGNSASDLRTYSDNKAANAYSNAVSYIDTSIGTANSAITSNAATAYSNAVSYVDGKSYVNTSQLSSNLSNYVTTTNLTNNLANYQTTAGLAGNVATLAANSATYLGNSSGTITNIDSWITSNASAAYSNSISYTDTKIATANSAITANAATAYTNAVSYVDGKSYVNTSQLSNNLSNYALLSGATFTGNVVANNANTTYDLNVGRNLTVAGNLTITGNVTVIGANTFSIVDNMFYLNSNNTTQNVDLGFAGNYNDGTYHHAGFFRDATDGVWKVFDNYGPEPDAAVNIDTTNTTFHLANFQANVVYIGNTTVYSTVNTTNFTGTSNNSLYLGGTAASGYQTTAGLSANVATLTSNNSTYAYGKTEGNLNVNSAVYANGSSTNTFTVGTASYFVANGNVGIGTSSPGYKLDISGTAQINGGGSQPLRLTTSSSGPWALELYRSDTAFSVKTYNDGSGWYFTPYITGASSVRSPIFYDSDNTGYYVDPASTSNLNGLTVASTITGSVSGSAASALTLTALGNYTWSASTLPMGYNQGIQSSFVSASQGFQSYGSVMTMSTYSGGGGALQLYVPYSPTYGGSGLQVRFGNYDVSSGNSWTSWKTLLASDNYTSYNTYNNFYINSGYQIYARYTSDNSYTGSFNWYGLQLGNNGGNFLVAGRTAVGGSLSVYTNNTSDFPTVNGTLSARFDSDGRFYSYVDTRSPLFYDYNNTAYYVDPASTTVLNALTVGGVAITGAGGLTVSDDTSTNASYYPIIATATSGSQSSAKVSSTKLYFNPSTGTLSATIFNSLSDITLKDNIKPFDGLSLINSINPVEYTWKDTGNKSYGVIAQELEEHFPELVETNEQGLKTVSYMPMIAMLIDTVKKQQKQIDQLIGAK